MNTKLYRTHDKYSTQQWILTWKGYRFSKDYSECCMAVSAITPSRYAVTGYHDVLCTRQICDHLSHLDITYRPSEHLFFPSSDPSPCVLLSALLSIDACLTSRFLVSLSLLNNVLFYSFFPSLHYLVTLFSPDCVTAETCCPILNKLLYFLLPHSRSCACQCVCKRERYREWVREGKMKGK